MGSLASNYLAASNVEWNTLSQCSDYRNSFPRVFQTNNQCLLADPNSTTQQDYDKDVKQNSAKDSRNTVALPFGLTYKILQEGI